MEYWSQDMGETTGISWCNSTFNLVWGCTRVSPGCTNCYAATLSERYGLKVWGPQETRRTFGEKHWKEPLSWEKKAAKGGRPYRVFCSSMCDIFEDHPVVEEELKKLWPLIRATPHLTWQLLTKRVERIPLYLPPDWGKSGYPNCWLGVSVENQDYAWRADALVAIPAAIRFISYEPALGPLKLNLDGIHWVIYGGESGPGYREDDPMWAIQMFLATRKSKSDNFLASSTGTAFFFKQTSGPRPGMIRHHLDGLELVREFPREIIHPPF